MPVVVQLSEFGVPSADDDDAWREALGEVEAAGGGVLLFDQPGESRVRSPVRLPTSDRGFGLPIRISGLGRSMCTIVGNRVDGPVLTWDEVPSRSVFDFVLEGLTIRRLDDETATPSGSHAAISFVGDSAGRIVNSRFSDLMVLQNGNAADALIDLGGLL